MSGVGGGDDAASSREVIRARAQWRQHGDSSVEWTFVTPDERTMFVRITEAGFRGTGDELLKKLNLVADRYPKGIDAHWT
jgi:hypothetical protein